MSRQVATVPTGLQRVEVPAFLLFPRKAGEPILSVPGGVGEKDARYPLSRAYTFPSSPSAKMATFAQLPCWCIPNDRGLMGSYFRALWPLAIVLSLAACAPTPPKGLEGCSLLAGDTWVRLVTIGPRAQPARPGDYISPQLSYATMGDSVFFRGMRTFQLVPSQYEGSIDACFATMSKGDSAVFYLDAKRFFSQTLSTTLPSFLDSGDRVAVAVRMLDVQDSMAFAQEHDAFLSWIADLDTYEQTLLQQFLKEHRIEVKPIDSIYYLPLQKGQGPLPVNGDTLTLEFEGRFLDGSYFDSTKKRYEPFVFVLGQQWQLIDGLERAVRWMREGEKAIFILPSSMAFGQEGSSTGIIPPYTTVIFEVELLKVAHGPSDGSPMHQS